MITLLLVIAIAHGGWWSDFCDRHLAGDDPYQYESAPVEWLIQQREFYQIREQWNKLTTREATHLRIIRRELARRGL